MVSSIIAAPDLRWNEGLCEDVWIKKISDPEDGTTLPQLHRFPQLSLSWRQVVCWVKLQKSVGIERWFQWQDRKLQTVFSHAEKGEASVGQLEDQQLCFFLQSIFQLSPELEAGECSMLLRKCVTTLHFYFISTLDSLFSFWTTSFWMTPIRSYSTSSIN